VASTIQRSLRAYGFTTAVAYNGVEGLQEARRHPPDAVLLDVIMPGMDGFEVCRELRNDPILSDVPILFLTARGQVEDRIMGFRAGADDYIGKPFNVEELVWRVRAILRRRQVLAHTQEEQRHAVQVGEYTLDTRSFTLTTPHGSVVMLTPVQFDLLYHLMSHPGQVFSQGRLLEEVWNYPANTGSPDLVRVHIRNLREKVEVDPANPTFIVTTQGHGYSVAPNPL
jgi:DNA-binding response OmpR family regulator